MTTKKEFPPPPPGMERVYSKTITVKGVTRRHPTGVYSWLVPIGQSLG